MSSRVKAAFQAVKRQAASRLSWLGRVGLRRCKAVEKEHAKKWRQFMHAGCTRFSVCVAAAAEDEMTDRELVGMLAHEFGHIVGDELGFPAHIRNPRTPKAVQDEANWIAGKILGIRIRYNRRTLQETS